MQILNKLFLLSLAISLLNNIICAEKNTFETNLEIEYEAARKEYRKIQKQIIEKRFQITFLENEIKAIKENIPILQDEIKQAHIEEIKAKIEILQTEMYELEKKELF